MEISAQVLFKNRKVKEKLSENNFNNGDIAPSEGFSYEMIKLDKGMQVVIRYLCGARYAYFVI